MLPLPLLSAQHGQLADPVLPPPLCLSSSESMSLGPPSCLPQYIRLPPPALHGQLSCHCSFYPPCMVGMLLLLVPPSPTLSFLSPAPTPHVCSPWSFMHAPAHPSYPQLSICCYYPSYLRCVVILLLHPTDPPYLPSVAHVHTPIASVSPSIVCCASTAPPSSPESACYTSLHSIVRVHTSVPSPLLSVVCSTAIALPPALYVLWCYHYPCRLPYIVSVVPLSPLSCIPMSKSILLPHPSYPSWFVVLLQLLSPVHYHAGPVFF